MNYDDLPHKDIFCMDMKCFYASCMAVLEGLDVLEGPSISNFEAASPMIKGNF